MIAKFKLRFDTPRARVVVAGAEGPGVDLVGDDAARAVALAAPLVAWVRALEPGVVLRSVSFDLEAVKLVATLEASPKPRVVRADGAVVIDLKDRAPDLLRFLEERARAKLAARRT